jgi:hypothetical protein
MNSWRKLALISLFCLGLLVSAAAVPASANTFYGDLYLGFSLNTDSLGGLTQGLDLNALAGQMTLPFRGKVYYQDGMIRMDVDIPALASLAGAKSAKDVKAFEVYSALINLKENEYLLLNHGIRQAFRLRIPPEMIGPNPYKDPYSILSSKEFIQGVMQGGGGKVKYLHTRRLKVRTIQGLKAGGVEMMLKVKMPEADMQAMQQAGLNFNGIFTLRLYYELESKFPILYELDSELLTATLQLVNIRRDRLPDVLFEVPEFYAVKDYTVDDLAQMMLGVAQEAEGLSGKLTTRLEAPVTPPAAEGNEAAPPADGSTPPPDEGGSAPPPETPPEEPPPGTTAG